MADILRTFCHVGLQFGVGVTAGSVVDSVFPVAGEDKSSANLKEVAMLTAEIAVQLLADGLMAALFAKALQRLQVQGLHDPHGGLTYTFALLESQPELKKKIHRVSNYIIENLRDEEKKLHVEWLDGRARGSKLGPSVPLTTTRTSMGAGQSVHVRK